MRCHWMVVDSGVYFLFDNMVVDSCGVSRQWLAPARLLAPKHSPPSNSGLHSPSSDNMIH